MSNPWIRQIASNVRGVASPDDDHVLGEDELPKGLRRPREEVDPPDVGAVTELVVDVKRVFAVLGRRRPDPEHPWGRPDEVENPAPEGKDVAAAHGHDSPFRHRARLRSRARSPGLGPIRT
jgi:hypothetical protein